MATGKMILCARHKDTQKQGNYVSLPVCRSSSRSSIIHWSESISVIESGSGTELLTEDGGRAR